MERSWTSGNRLHWEGLSADESEYSGLPTNGFAEFSSGGQVIKHSSFDARGVRELADKRTMVAAPGLQLQDLLSMNPYELSDGNVVDKVQQNSMKDFYRNFQYYLHNFIAANPLDIGDIRDIAEDDQAKNSEWYGTVCPLPGPSPLNRQRSSYKKAKCQEGPSSHETEHFHL